MLDALEEGWRGPPFDPFELAERAGVETVPREDLDDARLVAEPGEQPRIEFNPHRRPARVRFSVAHELGHLLFSDHAAQTRYRTESHTEHARPDDWQLEVLCNVAAAEILMPAGAFPAAYADDLSLPHLMDLRIKFGVSTEALLRRVVKLTERAVCLFAATRLPDGGFRVDYTVPSHAFDVPAIGRTDDRLAYRARALHGRRLLRRRHRGVARDRRRRPSPGGRRPTVPGAPLPARGWAYFNPRPRPTDGSRAFASCAATRHGPCVRGRRSSPTS